MKATKVIPAFLLALVLVVSTTVTAFAVPCPAEPAVAINEETGEIWIPGDIDGDTTSGGDSSIIPTDGWDKFDEEPDESTVSPSFDPDYWSDDQFDMAEHGFGVGEFAVIRTGMVSCVSRISQLEFVDGVFEKNITYADCNSLNALCTSEFYRDNLLYDGRADRPNTIVRISTDFKRHLTLSEAGALGWLTIDPPLHGGKEVIYPGEPTCSVDGARETIVHFVDIYGNEIHAPLYAWTYTQGTVIGYLPVMEVDGYTPMLGVESCSVQFGVLPVTHYYVCYERS